MKLAGNTLLEFREKVLASLKLMWWRLVFYGRVKLAPRIRMRQRVSIRPESPNALIEIGEHCFFNSYCSITCHDHISIGSNCLFGEGVRIYDYDHMFTGADPINRQGVSTSAVYVGDNCWIGSNTVILKGSSIGRDSVIGAGTVITGFIPEGSRVYQQRKLVIEQIKQTPARTPHEEA